MIRLQNVQKYFGNIPAIRNVSLEIKKGEIVGFLGQNGAGKTTLMRMMTTYLPATSGQITVNGKDALRESQDVRRSIGYLPENPPLYMDMRVWDYLKFAAQLKEVPFKNLKKSMEKTIQECHLTDVAYRTISTLSKGYKQRVGIAQAIIHNPPVLILDEPTSGLDPVQVTQVRSLIKNEEKRRTVILSTHILSEIEQIAERVVIIKKGEVILDALMEDILKAKEAKVKSLEELFLRLHQDHEKN